MKNHRRLTMPQVAEIRKAAAQRKALQQQLDAARAQFFAVLSEVKQIPPWKTFAGKYGVSEVTVRRAAYQYPRRDTITHVIKRRDYD